MKTITQAEFVSEAVARFGDNALQWKFVCPACGTVQTAQQLIDALKANKRDPKEVEGYIGFSCIGRFTGAGDEGIAAKSKGKPWDKGCNWTLGGLFRIHNMEVVMPDGHRRPCFEFAETN